MSGTVEPFLNTLQVAQIITDFFNTFHFRYYNKYWRFTNIIIMEYI